MKKTFIAAMCVLILAGHLSAQQPAVPFREVADQDIDRAIDEAKRFLYGRQNADGYWIDSTREVPSGSGQTAIALFALLEGGESPADERLAKAIAYLAKAKTDNTYVIAVRVMVLAQVYAANKDTPYRARLEADVKFLTANAEKIGAWGYAGPEKDGDNSCSQFALMALWEADRVGIEVKTEIIRAAEATWLRRQRPDGGWTYAGQPLAATDPTPSTVTMTTAGLASMYICQDMLVAGLQPYAYRGKIEQAWKYLAANLKDDFYKNGYLIFCLQRVAMASGARTIGDKDWFAVAAAKLAEPNPKGRGYDSQYGSIVQASFELIFLSRSRLPMTFNKLEYGTEISWNLYPRDVPRFTDYMRRRYEIRMRWQTVKITDDVRLLLDAPILLLEGNAALALSPDQVDKLRDYTLRGGTLLLVANNSSTAFIESARKMLGEMYKDVRARAGQGYEVTKFDDNSPIYQGNTKIDKGSAKAVLDGVSDGTRVLAILCHRDIAKPWQSRTLTEKLDYNLAENIYFYVSGGNPMLTRLRPVFAASPGQPRKKARIAWLKHEGNWYTQPFALDYLSDKLAAESKVGIDTQAGVEISADKLKGFDLAWMTGTEGFTLKDSEIQAIREYLDNGGTLFVNAVGGSKKFNESAREMLDKIVPESEATAGTASVDSSVISGRAGDFRGPEIKTLQRTRIWRTTDPKLTTAAITLYSKAGRPIVIYCPFGIHDTLDGHTAQGAASYMPATARELAVNIVLTALMDKPKTASTTSAPTTQK